MRRLPPGPVLETPHDLDGNRDVKRNKTDDRGQAAIEFVGVITILLIAALGAIQLGIAAYAMQQAGTGARAAARAASYAESDTDAQTAGSAAISGWLSGSFPAADSGDRVTVTGTVQIPSILPFFNLGPAVRSATMPKDDD
jgi:Flp pilus assembly protein TadG